MAIDRKRLRWNGWGWIDAPDVLGAKADAVWRWMGRTFGTDPLPETPPVPLESVRLPEIRLDAKLLSAFRQIVEPSRFMTDAYERAFHAFGRSYHDLLYLRSGHIDSAPDAVIYPVTEDEVLAVLRLAAKERVAVVPFGGGSSVVGGVNATAEGGYAGIITLDMTLMDRLLGVDETSLVARAEAGVYGPQLEDALQVKGYTLGHYPQSFEFSTLGGWIAPRSAGHQSNRYGKAEEWLVSARVVTPEGIWTTEAFPGSAAGPQTRDIIAGSEGVLGVITEAEFRIYPAPEVKDYRGYVFPDFSSGVAAARDLNQQEVPTAMIRLSDAPETFFYNGLHTGGEGMDSLDDIPGFCLMLAGLEGDKETVDGARTRSRAIIERNGGMHMGEEMGQVWYKGRFEMPYLRDPMMDRGLGVDTLETATRWSNLVALHDATCNAIAEALAANAPQPGAHGIVLAHVSHSYRDGASLYFTFAFPRALDREVEQWLAVKRAASDAIAAHGGTISHHHGVGLDHLPWIEREKGPMGIGAIRAIKERVDPMGIMNPGKLLARGRPASG